MPQAIVADEFIQGYNEVKMFAEKWIEIEEFSELFEADDPKTQEAVENNKQAKSGISGGVAKMVNAIKTIISNIRTAIQSFFKKLKMSDAERKAYEAIKNDPAMKNKKVTVMNYQELSKEYDSLNNRCEQALKEVDNGKTEFDELFNSIKGFTGKLGKGVAGAFTLDAALRIAASDKRKAQLILTGLKHDETLCNELMDSVGEKKFNEFNKNVGNLAKSSSLKALILRRKMNMAQAYTNSLTGNIELAFKDAIGGFGIKGAKDAFNDAKETKKEANATIKDAMTRDLKSGTDLKDAIADIHNARADKAEARNTVRGKAWNSGRLISGMSGTREGKLAGEVTKGVAKGAAQGLINAKKAEANAKKAAKKAEREERFISGKRRRIKKSTDTDDNQD